MNRPFDSDTPALRHRAKLNAVAGKHDLEQWILSYARPSAGENVLDLGCGTGKQLFALQSHVLPDGSLMGLDLSADAVGEVNRRAAEEGLSHISAVQGSLNDVVQRLSNKKFDLIISTYAIYYAADLPGLLRDLKKLLTADGRMFICGYGKGTNGEMIELVRRMDESAPAETIGDWLPSDQIEILKSLYGRVEVRRLENCIHFASADDVMNWWRNHNNYVPALDERMEHHIQDAIGRNGSFGLTKNVLGIEVHV